MTYVTKEKTCENNENWASVLGQGQRKIEGEKKIENNNNWENTLKLERILKKSFQKLNNREELNNLINICIWVWYYYCFYY